MKNHKSRISLANCWTVPTFTWPSPNANFRCVFSHLCGSLTKLKFILKNHTNIRYKWYRDSNISLINHFIVSYLIHAYNDNYLFISRLTWLNIKLLLIFDIASSNKTFIVIASDVTEHSNQNKNAKFRKMNTILLILILNLKI